MLTWAEFAHARPDLAEAGRRLLYQFGVGLGFLATVRADGGPRLHSSVACGRRPAAMATGNPRHTVWRSG